MNLTMTLINNNGLILAEIFVFQAILHFHIHVIFFMGNFFPCVYKGIILCQKFGKRLDTF